MSLWMKGTSRGVARRMREKTGWPMGEVSGTMFGSGAAVGGGGGAAAAILVRLGFLGE
ncbi:hypothetical protein YC2023_036428 [Brassica napus]